jgi:hypothetical protein
MPVVRRLIAATALTFCVGLAVLASGPGAASASDPGVKITAASIGLRSLTGPTRDDPVKIDPKHKTTLSVTLQNNTAQPAHVRYLELSGAILGIRFVNYQASATADILPGETRTITTPADFFDVDRAAMGYVNANLQVVDDQRATIASQAFVGDVLGKFWSSEGILFLEVLVIAIISLADIGVSVARRRLPRNRFVSGILFAFAAASTVITIVIGAAMARVALFESSAWIPALFVATAGAFVLGYISPGRLVKTAPDATEDRVLDLVAADAVARATGDHERRTTGGNVAHSSGDHTGVVAAHESGGFAPAHESGGFAPAHESGGFTPPHESGEFAPAPKHESGNFEPLE